ncbi:MAG: Histone acetyltransferase type B subunit 2 [Phylliscum demangeonii]|nr:MAG: Histone acetyltransferase type B subunit 2 [Phylliscum demangeonii]
MSSSSSDEDMEVNERSFQQVRQDEDIVEERLINEEYKTWKKNAPFLYDMMLSSALEWPTLTTQWFPDKQSNPDENFSTHRLLLGTHTSGDAGNYIQIAELQLPNSIQPDVRDYDPERKEIGGFGPAGAGGKDGPEMKVKVIHKIDHPGEVNKARYMPQNPDMIASMCVDGKVMIWDKTKHASIPTGTPNPQMQLVGHVKEGFGLGWSPHQEGHLATGSEDTTVRLWDITTYTKAKTTLSPTQTFKHHSSIVNDVQYHPQHRNLIGSVSDDLTFQVIDARQPGSTRAQFVFQHQRDAINALAFHPKAEFIAATASADKTIAIWDIRFEKDPMHLLQGHRDAVSALSWHPHEEAVLASSSNDRRIIFWDLSKTGDEQTDEEQEDGPPELLFMHGGHTNRISDFSWNLHDPWVMVSAAEDNLIQVWKVAQMLLERYPNSTRRRDTRVDQLDPVPKTEAPAE